MPKISRRAALVIPAAALGSDAVSAAPVRMTLAMHQNTSSGAGFRRSLEGWAKAGIRNVEITNTLLDDFLKTDTLAGARQLITDLGLTVVHAATGVNNLWEPHPNNREALENLKRRCDMFAALGVKRVYSASVTTQKVTTEDYGKGVENMRNAADVAKQAGMSLRIEFTRVSSFVATLPTVLKMTREAAHPNIAPMLDCYHFWSGLNKLEDLDAIRPGEIAHVHFQDVPDMPRELLDTTTRVMPGDGVSPLTTILRKLAAKGYAGPLSVELLNPKFQQADPYEIARDVRQKAEAVMRRAGVL
jgi:4-hydroxyphenylpyruvate dioxygenase